jgi:hypothetical protein
VTCWRLNVRGSISIASSVCDVKLNRASRCSITRRKSRGKPSSRERQHLKIPAFTKAWPAPLAAACISSIRVTATSLALPRESLSQAIRPDFIFSSGSFSSVANLASQRSNICRFVASCSVASFSCRCVTFVRAMNLAMPLLVVELITEHQSKSESKSAIVVKTEW